MDTKSQEATTMKTKTTHTPGPWCYQPYNYPDQLRHEIWKSSDGEKIEGYRIAVIDDVTDGTGANRTQANARLIAAAPELLEAVKLLLPLAQSWSKAHKAASEAIAKAEGKV